jgi:hypothetical protein
MDSELHNYEPTCEEIYPSDFDHEAYQKWINEVHVADFQDKE